MKFYKNNLMTVLLMLFTSLYFLNQSPGKSFFHAVWGIVTIGLFTVYLVWIFNDDWNLCKGDNPFTPKLSLVFLPLILLFLLSPIGDIKDLYNTNKKVSNTFEKKKVERIGFYDNLWKTYVQKNDIAGMNKEVFIEIAKIQMENRRDGANVTWKWVQENTQIPYSQFSEFYKDLSTFIESQRQGYYNLEKECQVISYSQNILIDTFPNNIYSSILGIKPLVYSYGMLSDSTNKVFKSGIENLK